MLMHFQLQDILVVEEQCRALDAEVATLKAAIATKTVWTPDMLTEDAMAKLEVKIALFCACLRL